MSDVAFAHVICAATERAAAFARSVRTLGGTGRGLAHVHSLNAPSSFAELSLEEVDAWVARHYAEATELALVFGADLPSGRRAVIAANLSGAAYRGGSTNLASHLHLSIERQAFDTSGARQPRLLPWSRGLNAGLLQDELMADVAWLLRGWHVAIGALASSPLVLGWSGQFPSPVTAFGVCHAQPEWVARDCAAAWLAGRTPHPMVDLMALNAHELAQLVRATTTDFGAASGVLALRAEQVCALLAQDAERVRTAVSALAVVDSAQMERAKRLETARELMTSARDTEPAIPDWADMVELFPNVPPWRVTIEPDGAVLVVSAPFMNVSGFYESLLELLL